MASARETARILGVDPGSRLTGYAVLETRDGGGARVVAAGTLAAPAKDDLPRRLAAINRRLREIIEEHGPTEMAVEGVFAAKNVRSALALGQARGVILLAGAECGLSISEYSPSEVKKAAVGVGSASKEQVRAMVSRLLGIKEPLGLDTSDALAVAWTHLAGRAFRERTAR